MMKTGRRQSTYTTQAWALLLVLLVGCGSSVTPNATSERLLVPTLNVIEMSSYTFRFAALGLALQNDATESDAESDGAYSWDFGDGQRGTGRVTEHTYAAEGRYEVTLEVTDADGTPYTLTRFVYARSLELNLTPGTPGIAQGTEAYTLENATDAPLAWTTEAEHDPANPAPEWFEARPSSGTLAGGERVTLDVSPKPGLEPGFYFSTVTLAHARGSLEFDMAAQVGSTQPRVSLSVPRAVVTQGRSEAELSVWVRGFEESVYLSLADAPAALGLRLPDPKISDTETALLSVSPTSDAPLGEHRVTLNARGADTQASVVLTVEVLERGAGRARVSGEVVTDNAAIDIPVGASSSEQGSGAEPSDKATAQPAFVPGQLLLSYRTEPGAAGGQASTTRGEFSKGQTGQRRALVDALARTYGVKVTATGGPGQPDLALLAPGQDVMQMAAKLARDPRVAYAEPNYYLEADASDSWSAQQPQRPRLPSDPQIPEQWALAAAGVPAAWPFAEAAAGRGADSVVVAVLDTGFDLAHPDLAARFLPGYDFCSGSADACTGPADDNPSYGESFNGHGTHVAGLIGAARDNGEGIAGVARDVRLLPVKVFNDFGEGATSLSLIRGIRWAAGLSVNVEGAPLNTNPARIINMSLGGTFKSSLVQKAIDDARETGALLVAATGNDGTDALRTPAAAKDVLGVGSVNTRFERSCFSNYGERGKHGPGAVDLMAPGGDTCSDGRGVLSTLPGGYGEQAGTSMAAPIVSGLAALALAAEPGLGVDELEATLLDATYFDERLMDKYSYGAGVIRAEKLFGLPSPGDEVTVKASGEGSGADDRVTLDLYGGSEPFTLTGLREESHTLEVLAGTSNRTFKDSKGVKLAVGELKTDIRLSLEP